MCDKQVFSGDVIQRAMETRRGELCQPHRMAYVLMVNYRLNPTSFYKRFFNEIKMKK